jgi:hypothetical protein
MKYGLLVYPRWGAFSGAKPARMKRGETLVTDGPFVSTKEALGGRVHDASGMELAGLEPATSWVRSRRSPN